MASFNSTKITNRGRELDAKVSSGQTRMSFTKICLSDTAYSSSSVETLTSLSGVKQTSVISEKKVINDVSVQVSSVFTNEQLTSGYFIRTIGLYAQDPDRGEILYSVTTAIEADYMPPYNGLSSSSILVDLVSTISNAENVELEVDPAAAATIRDINELKDEIEDLKGRVGYTDSDIVGVEVDIVNNTFTRLAGAVGLNPGEDFNVFNMYGGRKRCNLSDAGEVTAYYGDAGYSATGSNGQVMVEQPKFFYKFVPLNLFKVEGQEGWSCDKFRIYLSDTARRGFKIHPNFTRGVPATIKDFIYSAAYKGSIYDASANTLLLNDEQVADFAADKLCSISGAKPCSGVTQNLTRANTRKLANNRGSGFQITDFLSNSATQMLFLVEYASFDTQSKIGMGVVSFTDDGATNMAIVNGGTDNLGNISGMANGDNGKVSITYRGEENFWGNIWSWEDGLNIEVKGLPNAPNAFFALGNFADDTKAEPYKDVGFQLATASGYVNAIGYSEVCDFAFLATRTSGASNRPLNDYFYQNNTYNGFLVSILGGRWYDGSDAGGFSRDVYDAAGARYRYVGGRLLFVPSGGKEVE